MQGDLQFRPRRSCASNKGRGMSHTKWPRFTRPFAFPMNVRTRFALLPWHDEQRTRSYNTRLLSFTFSASRYTLLPISLNFCDIFAIPSSMTPDIAIPTAAGSFSVAA
jgi:hypothetical protein